MRAIEGSYNPTIPSLYQDPDVLKAAPFFGELYDVFTNAVARPSSQTAPKYSAASQLVFTAVHEILTGQKRVHDVVEALQADLEDLLAK